MDAKTLVGNTVASWIESGQVLGIGTGSTALKAIEALGRRITEEGIEVRGVPTSFASERACRAHGIPLTNLDVDPVLDIAFDGADEVDPYNNLIKGRGAAQTRERVVAAAASRFVVLVDDSKIVDRLGTRMPVPVEVLPMAIGPVERALRSLGGEPSVREGQKKDGPVVTDQGFWILDVDFASGIDDVGAMAAAIKQLPGVLDHGIFHRLATDVLIGTLSGDVTHRR